MGKVIPVNFRPGLMPVATAGSSAVALEAAPQMIIENVQEASQALGILKTTLMQAGKVAGSGVVAGGGGFSLAHDIGSASSTTEPQSSTSGGSTSEYGVDNRRVVPKNLQEQLAMQQVKSDPLRNAKELPITLNDPRWPASEGWVKMQSIVETEKGKITIHFVFNKIKHIFDDFKFIDY